MALETERLKIKLIQETDQVSNKAWNDVIEDIDKKVAPQSHVGDRSHFEMWEKNKSYAEGDIIRYSSLKSNQYAICLSGGQSDTLEPTNNVTGSEINVGSARFKIVTLDKGTVEEFKINAWASGTYYKSGSFVIYGDAIYKCKANHVSDNAFATDKDKWIELFSSIRTWKKNTYYAVGDTVLNGTDIVMCKTEHTSAATHEEDKWEYVGNFALLEDWEKQKDYKKGQIVIFEKELYRAKEAHKSSNTFAKTKWEKVTRSGGIADWEANKSYSKDDVVYYAKNIYRATGDIKDTNFIPSNWERITDNIKFWDTAKTEPYVKGDTAVVHNILVTIENIGTTDLGSNTTPLNASIASYDTDALKYPVGAVVENKGTIYKKMANDLESDFTSFTNAVTAGSWAKLSNSQITSYDNTKTYVEGDIVFAEGAIYKALKNSQGKKPPNSEFWEELVKAGQAKVDPWMSTTDYKTGQVVLYNGYLLRVKTAHISGTEIDFTKFDVVYSGIPLHSTGNSYVKDSVVRTSGGNLYFAKKDVPKSKDIDEQEFWQRTTTQASLADWQANKQYNTNDIVVKDGNIYRATSDSKDAVFNATKFERLVQNNLTYINEWATNSAYEKDQILRSNGLLLKSLNSHVTGSDIDVDKYSVLYASIAQWGQGNYYPEGTVVRDNIGNLYEALSNTKDAELNNGVYWRKLKPTADLYDWVAGIQYFSGDLVWYKNNVYRAKTDSKDTNFDFTNWEKITQNGAVKVGEWKTGQNYEQGEILKSSQGNQFYYVSQNHTSTDIWSDVGNNLVNMFSVRDFANEAYSRGEIIRYEGKLYRAKTNIASKPKFEYADWDVLTYSLAVRDWKKNTPYDKETVLNIDDVAYHLTDDFTTGDDFSGEFGITKPLYAGLAEWKEGANYQKGVTVVSEGYAYKCLQNHKSLAGSAGYVDKGNLAEKYPGGNGIYHYVTGLGQRVENYEDFVEFDVTASEIDHLYFNCTDSTLKFGEDIKVTITPKVNGVASTPVVLFNQPGRGTFPKILRVNRTILKVRIDIKNSEVKGVYIEARAKNPLWKRLGEATSFSFPLFVEPDANRFNHYTYDVGNIIEYQNKLYRCKNACTNYNGFVPTDWEEIGSGAGSSEPAIKNYVNGNTYHAGDFVYYDKALYRAKSTVTTTTNEPKDTEFDKIGGESKGTIIADWDKTKDYNKDDMVFYEGKMYRATAPITHAENFQTGWMYVNEEAFARDWEANKGYQKDEVVFHDGLIYRAKAKVNKPTFEKEDWQTLTKSEAIKDWQTDTVYKHGDVVVHNSGLWRAGSDHTSTGTFDISVWENLSGGGGGTAAGWKQVTKLNAPSNTRVVINFPETLTFCFPPIDVLQLQPGTTNVTMNSYTFDVGDGSKFEYDNKKVMFDGMVHCKTGINIKMTEPTPLETGFICISDDIDINDYNSIEEIMI